jgi:hypothetical protein
MFSKWQSIARRAFAVSEPGLNFISRGVTSWVPAAALITGIAFWHITADIETIGPRVVCAAACLALIRAARTAGYFWVAAFGAIAVIFNPFVPGMMSRIAFFGLYFVFASTVLLGLAVLKLKSWQHSAVSLWQSNAEWRSIAGPEER